MSFVFSARERWIALPLCARLSVWYLYARPVQRFPCFLSFPCTSLRWRVYVCACDPFPPLTFLFLLFSFSILSYEPGLHSFELLHLSQDFFTHSNPSLCSFFPPLLHLSASSRLCMCLLCVHCKKKKKERKDKRV